MPLPLLFALILAKGQAAGSSGTQTAQTPTTASTQATTIAPPFSSPFTIAEPNRIALTPKIDGVLDDEEWDPISTSADMKSYFQWEPGKLHFAAFVPTGHDVLASFDLKANGWLIGKDNLEVRISNASGQVTIVARLLDNTNPAGPKWIDLPGMALSSTAAAITNGPNTIYEATIGDPGIGIIPTEVGTKLMMRIDDPLSTDPPAPAYFPRSVSPVTLVYLRSAATPAGLKFNAEGTGRAAVAGEGTKVRLTFNGNNEMKLQHLELRSEGFAKNDTNALTVPFPKFDSKGRSFVDYVTPIADGSPAGYRVLKGTLTTADNISAVLEASYRIGPPIDIDIPRELITVAAVDRSVKYAFYAKSNSSKRISGELTISVPDPLRVLNGADHKIDIYTNRGSDRQIFELFLPPNTSGTFPVKFTGVINKKKTEITRFITIGGI